MFSIKTAECTPWEFFSLAFTVRKSEAAESWVWLRLLGWELGVGAGPWSWQRYHCRPATPGGQQVDRYIQRCRICPFQAVVQSRETVRSHFPASGFQQAEAKTLLLGEAKPRIQRQQMRTEVALSGR